MVKEELFDLLKENYDITETDFEPMLSIEDMAMDSLEYLHMLNLVEEKFAIELTDSDRVSIEYVNDLVRVVEGKLATKPRATAN